MKLERATVRRFLLGVVAPVTVSLLASYVIYQFILASNASLQAVSLSYQRISSINTLIKTVLDAETGMRGFILTGNESFLQPYNDSLIRVGSELGTLRRLLDDEESQSALDEIDKVFETWRREIAEVSIRGRRTVPLELSATSANAYIALLEARRAEARYRQGASPEALVAWGSAVSSAQAALERIASLNLSGSLKVQASQLSAGFEAYSARVATPNVTPDSSEEASADELAALLRAFSHTTSLAEQNLTALIRSGTGKMRIDQVRAYVSSIGRQAESTLQANLEVGGSNTRLAQIVAFAGPIAAAIFALIAVILSQRALNRSARRLTEVTEAVSDGHFDRRLRVVRGEELWRLTQNFNTMASDLSARERQASLLGQMGKMLQTCSDSDELYRITSHFAPELFPTFDGALYIISASRNMLQSCASWGDFPAESKVHTPQECWAIRQGQSHLSRRGHSENDIFCQHASKPTPYESLCIPLTSQDETLGMFFLYTRHTDRPLTSGMQRLAATVAENLALALSNLKLREKLRHQSIRDPLTGLFNRRHLEETLDLELHRAARRGESLSLVMFDVDHFKRYNDTFGHDAGDSVLQHLSSLVQGHIRAGDVACRYGGEEFLLVQPGMSTENALTRAENLRESVARLALEHRGMTLESITISVGIAVYPQTAQGAEDLIKRADEALYEAKRGGRNQVVLATGTVEIA